LSTPGGPAGLIHGRIEMETQAPEVTLDEREVQDATAIASTAEDALVVDELLIEDVSIDGMCGVY
jgi:mycofactocin precursor